MQNRYRVAVFILESPNKPVRRSWRRRSFSPSPFRHFSFRFAHRTAIGQAYAEISRIYIAHEVLLGNRTLLRRRRRAYRRYRLGHAAQNDRLYEVFYQHARWRRAYRGAFGVQYRRSAVQYSQRAFDRRTGLARRRRRPHRRVAALTNVELRMQNYWISPLRGFAASVEMT